MPKITVTLSANAGVAIDIDGRRIWVDALHDRKVEGFSTLTPRLQREMMNSPAFSHPEYICYTHLHPDHYSESLTGVAQQLWPNAKLLLPGQSVEANGLQLQYVKLPHEGEQYADVPHFGLIVRCNGCNVLLPGDCETASDQLTKAIGSLPVHLVLLNFPWATLRKGKLYIQEQFSDSHIILYHLPFEEDDIGAYRRSALSAAEAMQDGRDIRLLMQPLQTEQINI